MIEIIGPNLTWLVMKIGKANSHQVRLIGNKRSRMPPHSNKMGCWVSHRWIKEHFPANYAAGILDGTDCVEICQQQALEAVYRLRR